MNQTTSIQIQVTEWTGIGSPNGGINWDPSDNALAADQNRVITAENSAILLSDLHGRVIADATLSQFFSTKLLSGYSLVDPQIVYDTQSGHFVVSVGEVDPSDIHSPTFVLFAVSDNGHPNGLSASDWTFTTASTSYVVGGDVTQADQPALGINGPYIELTTDQYSGTGETPHLTTFTNAATPILVSQSQFSTIFGGSDHYQPVPDAQTGQTLYVGSGTFLGDDGLWLGHSSAAGVPSYPVFVDLGSINIGLGTASNYTAFELNNALLDAGDGRVTSAVIGKDGYLYTVFEIKSPLSGSSAVEWAKIDVSNPDQPQAVAEGTIDGTVLFHDSSASTFNASIAVDGHGDVLINFNASSKTLPLGDYFVLQRASDPTGTFSAPTAYTPHGAVADYDFGSRPGELGNAWGDYSAATADTTHSNVFWISNQYAASTQTWGTVIAEVTVPILGVSA